MTGSYDAGFHTRLMAKDVRLFLDSVGAHRHRRDGRRIGVRRLAARRRGDARQRLHADLAVRVRSMTAPLLPPPLAERDRAIVLVHGAWLGEWCWSPVLPLLRASGRPVINVSLTGHGARRHQSGPHITLGDHADDIVSAIESADAVNITLVAHSYGGRPATQAASRIADRLRSIVYVDAHAPLAANTGASDERQALADQHGGMLPYTGYDPDPDLLGGEEAGVDVVPRADHAAVVRDAPGTDHERAARRGQDVRVLHRQRADRVRRRTRRPHEPPPTGATSSSQPRTW